MNKYTTKLLKRQTKNWKKKRPKCQLGKKWKKVNRDAGHLVPGIGPGKTNMGKTLRRQEDLHFPEVRQERVPPSGCNFLPTSEAWQLSSGKIKEGCVWPAETFGQYGEGHEEM